MQASRNSGYDKQRRFTTEEKILYHSVFDLYPLAYMCDDIDSRLFSH